MHGDNDKLTAPKNSRKSIVVFIFSFRILVAASSLATLVAYRDFFTETNARISIGIARTVAWQEILLCFSLLTASIPCLKAFLDAFRSTGLMTVHGRNIVAYHPARLNADSQALTPSNVAASTAANSANTPVRPRLGTRHSSGVIRRLRPDKVSYNANVASQSATQGTSSKLPRMPESIESFRSDQLAIHRDFEVHVTHS